MIGKKSQIKEISGVIDVSNALCGPGVYLLTKGEEIVYIGRSVVPFARIGAHVLDKDFDGVFIVPVPEDRIADTEGALIFYLRPKLNGGERRKVDDSLMYTPGDPWKYKQIVEALGLKWEQRLLR